MTCNLGVGRAWVDLVIGRMPGREIMARRRRSVTASTFGAKREVGLGLVRVWWLVFSDLVAGGRQELLPKQRKRFDA